MREEYWNAIQIETGHTHTKGVESHLIPSCLAVTIIIMEEGSWTHGATSGLTHYCLAFTALSIALEWRKRNWLPLNENRNWLPIHSIIYINKMYPIFLLFLSRLFCSPPLQWSHLGILGWGDPSYLRAPHWQILNQGSIEVDGRSWLDRRWWRESYLQIENKQNISNTEHNLVHLWKWNVNVNDA